MSTRTDGDFSEVVPKGWVTLRQVHGGDVVLLGDDATGALFEGDSLVTASDTAILAVRGADCPLIGLSSEEGVIGAVHAGWRGLLAGVIEHTAVAMRSAGATTIKAVLGPYVGTECYAFSPGDLEVLAEAFGENVRGQTIDAAPALDLRVCITTCFSRADIEMAATLGGCTSCSTEFFSWRARRERMRHVLLITRRKGGTALSEER